MSIIDSLRAENKNFNTEVSTQLAISQKAGETYDKDTHDFLVNVLSVSSSKTTKELAKQQEANLKTSETLALLEEFKGIKKVFGDETIIIDYKSLVQLANKNNMYYGDSHLFTGEISKTAIAEAKAFNFGKANSFFTLGYSRDSQSVLEWGYGMNSYSLIILGPINMFAPNKKVIISNREIVQSKYGNVRILNKGKTEGECLLLLPFKSKNTKKVYFILITSW